MGAFLRPARKYPKTANRAIIIFHFPELFSFSLEPSWIFGEVCNPFEFTTIPDTWTGREWLLLEVDAEKGVIWLMDGSSPTLGLVISEPVEMAEWAGKPVGTAWPDAARVRVSLTPAE